MAVVLHMLIYCIPKSLPGHSTYTHAMLYDYIDKIFLNFNNFTLNLCWTPLSRVVSVSAHAAFEKVCVEIDFRRSGIVYIDSILQ